MDRRPASSWIDRTARLCHQPAVTLWPQPLSRQPVKPVPVSPSARHGRAGPRVWAKAAFRVCREDRQLRVINYMNRRCEGGRMVRICRGLPLAGGVWQRANISSRQAMAPDSALGACDQARPGQQASLQIGPGKSWDRGFSWSIESTDLLALGTSSCHATTRARPFAGQHCSLARLLGRLPAAVIIPTDMTRQQDGVGAARAGLSLPLDSAVSSSLDGRALAGSGDAVSASGVGVATASPESSEAGQPSASPLGML
ncbi:hypothetical protein F4780DRAFT_452653 [Xylariomycetidae sp. FL0641]|nr:hypothetical protein F4780DRAFT_452653 [Xylariomycetidae sp. FL0641]